MFEKPELHNSPKKLSILLMVCCIALGLSACAPKTSSTDRFTFASMFTKKDANQEFSPLKTLTPTGDAAAPPSFASADNVLSKNLFDTTAQNSKFCAVPSYGKTGNTPYDRLTKTAFTQLGKYYRSGGTDPGTGFDCSGFTSWVFASNGINIPRSSREQFLEGKVIERSQLQTGDLVFFRKKKTISHVGIYLENGQFIHSSRRGDTVKISSLSEPTWDKQYAGGRRIVRN
jgi:cell wall-associated NlpC family hydrolase